MSSKPCIRSLLLAILVLASLMASAAIPASQKAAKVSTFVKYPGYSEKSD